MPAAPNGKHRNVGYFDDEIEAAKAYRGFKSERGLWCFVTARFCRHNYFMPNKRLKGKTPAEAVGKKLPYCHDKLKLMMKFL
jgi:hypothetical protein